MKEFWAEWITRKVIEIIEEEKLKEVLLQQGMISFDKKEIRGLKNTLIKIPTIEINGEPKVIVPMGFLETYFHFHFLFIKDGEFDLYVHEEIPKEINKIINPLFLNEKIKNKAFILWISNLQNNPGKVKKDLKKLLNELPSFKKVRGLC